MEEVGITEMLLDYGISYRTDWRDLAENFPVSQEGLLQIFEEQRAYWFHNGDPAKPHAKLTKGHCSDGYIDCSLVLDEPILSELLAAQLSFRLKDFIGDEKVDRVIGSPNAGITFAHDVARMFNAKSGFPEKDPSQKTGMKWKRWTIQPGEKVLQVEELTTTGGTLMDVKKTVDRDNPYPVEWLPFVGILVHRPPKLPIEEYDGRRIVPLIETEIQRWSPSECPLCAQGSVPLRPKENWGKLKQK